MHLMLLCPEKLDSNFPEKSDDSFQEPVHPDGHSINFW